jgi:4-amino-4-deoxy-L-arabinose transferase-like glycosyltransferase
MVVMEPIMTRRPEITAAMHVNKNPVLKNPVLKNKAVWLAAVAAFLIEMAFSARYGYVRDELYFLAAGAHPAAGYVDQPSLTPLLAHLDALVTGNTLVGLRALPALGLAALVLLAAAMARVLGAGDRGQLLAGIAAGCCGEYLGAMHELTTAPLDFVAWAVVLYLVTRLLTSRDPRWWPGIGAAAGVGMSAKWNIGFLIAGLLLGFACTPAARPLLRGRYLACGAAAFVVLAAPDFIWQAAHGWPNLAVFSALQDDAWQNRVQYWPGQVLYTSILLVPLWLRGIRWALRHPLLRVIGIAAVFVIVVQFILGGKAYYPGGIYTFCFAAGAVSLEGLPWRRRAVTYLAAGAVSSLIALPVLPAAALARVPVQRVNYDLGEEIGWPSEVAALAAAWRALPPAERERATLLAGNYGEAGAVDRYGASFGLPQVYSGANSFWFWGPPPAADTVVVAVNVDPALLHREFAHVTQVAVYHNSLNVADDEQGAVIDVATGLRSSWTAAWPAFRNFS